MNWLLIIVLVIIVFSAVRGFWRGLLRVLFSLVSVIVLIGLITFATPHVSQFIADHTQIDTVISENISTKIQNSTEAAVDSAMVNQKEGLEAAGISLPEVLEKHVFENGVQGAEQAVADTGIYEQVADQMAGIIIAIVSFLIALIFACIIVWLIGKATDVVNKIPVIKGINRFLGFFAGGLEGFIIVWLFFMLVSIISGSQLGHELIQNIHDNEFLAFLYDHNAVLAIVSNFIS